MQFCKYEPQQRALALRPEAFGMMFMLDDKERKNEEIGDVTVVTVEGPLMAEHDCWFDSYQDIKKRFADACASTSKRIVMRISSPGGMVHECFALSRDLREMADASGKPFTAFIDEMACSAACALSVAADKIVISETGVAGSIGVIRRRFDASEYEAKEGFSTFFITSGDKKAYGHATLKMSEAELAAAQEEVDQYAEMFFALVAARRDLTPEEIEAYQAGTFIGAKAVEARLADEVGRFEDLLVKVENETSEQGSEVQVTLEQIQEALKALASGESDESKLATAMLAASSEQAEDQPSEDESEDESSEDEAEDQPADEEESEDEAEDEPSEDESEEDKAESLEATVARLKSEVEALKKTRKPAVTTVQPTVKAKAPQKSKLDQELDKAFGIGEQKGPHTFVEGSTIYFR